MSSTTDLDTLVINYLTQAQYESAKSGGTIDPDQIYLTPAQGTGVTDVEVDGSSVVSGGVAEVDLSGKADVSHTHTKSQITDFPTIPTITDTYSSTSSNGMSGKAVNSALQTLDGTVSGTAGSGKTLTAFSQTDGKVSATFGNISITKSQVSDFPALATVATTGDYDDLTDKPTIPTITDTYSGTSSDGMSGKAVKSAIDALDGTISGAAGAGKTLTAFSQTDGKVSATFSNISITKSQVSDFPTIPTVNNATLTIQKNGTTVKTFTANASSDVTANITVPTNVSQLNNDAGYITAVDYVVEYGTTDNWKYRKWDSGKYDAHIHSQFAINAGSAWIGGYYHATTYPLALPSFSQTWELVSAVKSDSMLSFCVGVAESSSGLTFYWVNGASGASNGSQFGWCDITIQGTWK